MMGTMVASEMMVNFPSVLEVTIEAVVAAEILILIVLIVAAAAVAIEVPMAMAIIIAFSAVAMEVASVGAQCHCNLSGAFAVISQL